MKDSCQPIRRAAFRWLAAVAGVFCILASTPALGHGGIPPVPVHKRYILDNAYVLSSQAMRKLGQMQKTAAQKYNTQIVVVTIRHKARYGGAGMSIAQFAHKWFDTWGIGIRRHGKLYNRGVLMLVSTGDRKARIELGAAWGHRWESYCHLVMNQLMVPQFKKGDYALGIARGMSALSKMARLGPSANPPKQPVLRQWMRMARHWTSYTSPFSGRIEIILSAIGLAMIILSSFIDNEKSRRWLFWGGIALIVIAILTYVAFFVVTALFGSDKTGGCSGGGGFGGGFSGGGGASGSW